MSNKSNYLPEQNYITLKCSGEIQSLLTALGVVVETHSAGWG